MGAVNAYVYNCVREVGRSVYGRDNRTPIADAIQQPTNANYQRYLELWAADNVSTEVDPDGSLKQQILDDEIAMHLISNRIPDVHRMLQGRVVKFTPVLQEDIVDWIERRTTATGLSLATISEEDRQFGSTRSSESAELIVDDDYLVTLAADSVTDLGNGDSRPNLGNSTWEIEPDGSIVSCQYIPHHETYVLDIQKANFG